MAKIGNIIEEKRIVGKGKNRRVIYVRVKVNGTVYYPEIEGKVDFRKWCLTEKEAILAERWHEIVKQTEPELKAVYKKREELMNQVRRELGLPEEKWYWLDSGE